MLNNIFYIFLFSLFVNIFSLIHSIADTYFCSPKIINDMVICHSKFDLLCSLGCHTHVTLIHWCSIFVHISHQWNSSKTNGSVRFGPGFNRISNHQKRHKAQHQNAVYNEPNVAVKWLGENQLQVSSAQNSGKMCYGWNSPLRSV